MRNRSISIIRLMHLNSGLRAGAALLFTATLCLACAYATDLSGVTLHVNAGHAAASDDNLGTLEQPLSTVGAALAQALTLRAAGRSTEVLIHPGVYRESLEYHLDNSNGPPITLRATEAGKAVISGSDIWRDWHCDDRVCEHPWPYTWGESANPWPQDTTITPIGLRREMIFVNAAPMVQRLTRVEMLRTPGSFYVSEPEGWVSLHLPPDAEPDAMVVEVAVRPRLMRLQGLNDLVVYGLVFQHANTPLPDTAVSIVDQRHVRLENIVVQHNNWGGVSLIGKYLTVRQSQMLHNGGNGISAYRAIEVLLEDNQTSFNNWRGALGGLTDWSVGEKFLQTRNLTIRRHVSTHNAARGLWLDFDNIGAQLEGLHLCHNLTDGIFIEANPGPIALRSSTLCNNGRFGLLTSSSENLSVTNSVLENNGRSQLAISGDLDVPVTDWRTGEQQVINNYFWTLTDNRVVSEGTQLAVSTSLPLDHWQRLMDTSFINKNTYVHADPATAPVFQIAGGARLSFEEWQRATQQDDRSQAVSP